MSTLEIHELPLVDKFRLMETLWEDMRGRVETMNVPAEHRRLLEERRERTRTGQTTPLELGRGKARHRSKMTSVRIFLTRKRGGQILLPGIDIGPGGRTFQP